MRSAREHVEDQTSYATGGGLSMKLRHEQASDAPSLARTHVEVFDLRRSWLPRLHAHTTDGSLATVGHEERARWRIERSKVVDLASQSSGSSDGRAGTGQPTSSRVAAMYSKTRLVASDNWRTVSASTISRVA